MENVPRSNNNDLEFPIIVSFAVTKKKTGKS